MPTQSQVNALNKIYNEYIDFDSVEKTVTNYSKLAHDYEDDVAEIGYDAPQVLSHTTIKHLHTNTPETSIYDVACGTGLVAEELVKAGYKGKVDGVDGSAGMLAIAESKKLYRNLTEAFVYPETSLEFPDSTFDAIVCCGGMAPGHLQPGVLDELVRVTKPQGVVVFSVRFNEHATPFREEVDKVITRLVGEGRVVKKEVFNTKYFDLDFCDHDKQMLVTVYCYQKL